MRTLVHIRSTRIFLLAQNCQQPETTRAPWEWLGCGLSVQGNAPQPSEDRTSGTPSLRAARREGAHERSRSPEVTVDSPQRTSSRDKGTVLENRSAGAGAWGGGECATVQGRHEGAFWGGGTTVPYRECDGVETQLTIHAFKFMDLDSK